MLARHLPLFALALSMLVAGCGTTPGASVAPTAATTVEAQKTDIHSTLEILGIGPAYAAALRAQGIKKVADLLEAGNTRADRVQLAKATGISPKLLMTWVNHADLMRITQVGPVYSRMLEDAGVDTVAELSTRSAQNLFVALQAVQTKGGKTMVDRMPSLATVSRWVERARTHGRYVEY